MLTGFWIESVFFLLSCCFPPPVYVRTRNGLATSHSWPPPPFVSVDVSSKTLQNWEWMSGVYQKSHANKRPGACCFQTGVFFPDVTWPVTFRDAAPPIDKNWCCKMTISRLELKRLFAAAWRGMHVKVDEGMRYWDRVFETVATKRLDFCVQNPWSLEPLLLFQCV